MQWLNYHHLYYFYIIAREGSVTAATKTLRLAQSTLSAQIKQFEESIGYQLFNRENRHFTLTDVGQKVYSYAHEIFSIGEELRDSLAKYETSLEAALDLGVSDSIPKSITKQLLTTIWRSFGARIKVFEESLTSLLSRLQKHEIELVLSNDKPTAGTDDNRFYSRLVGQLPVVFVGSKANSQLLHNFPESLNDFPLILPTPSSPLHQQVHEYLRLKHIRVEVKAEIDDIELQRLLVLEGCGVAALPLPAAEEGLRLGSLIRLSETPICHESIWLTSSHRLVQNPISRWLLETPEFLLRSDLS